MKQHLFGFVGLSLAVALAAGCKSNPQSELNGVPAAISASASHVVVNVADSVRVDAQVVDAQGTPLTMLPDDSSTDNTVASLSTINPYPVPETSFWVRGESFGAAKVILTSGSLADTITVQTYPARTRVGAPPVDTMMSGTVTTPYAIALDAIGDSIGSPADSFWWTSDHPGRLSVDSASGVMLAKQDGAATATLHVAGGGTGVAPTIVIPDTTYMGTSALTQSLGSALNGQNVTFTLAGLPAIDANTQVVFSGFLGLLGRDTAVVDTLTQTATSLTFPVPDQVGLLAKDSTYDLLIEGLGDSDLTVMSRLTVVPPPAFPGTSSADSVAPAQKVTVIRTGTGPAFTTSTTVSVHKVPTFVDHVSTNGDTLTFPVPPTQTVGPVGAVFAYSATADTSTVRQVVLTSTSAAADFHYPNELNPQTADTVSGNGTYYVVVRSGYKPDPLGDGPAVYMNFTAGATPVTVNVAMDWIDTSTKGDGDIDMFVCTGGCNSGGDFGADGFAGASTAKPEHDSFTIPAGQTWHLIIAQYAPASVSGDDLIQLTVTGYP